MVVSSTENKYNLKLRNVKVTSNSAGGFSKDVICLIQLVMSTRLILT